MWETSDWKPQIVRFERGSCLDVSFSPDGKTLAFTTAGTSVELFKIASGEPRRRISADATRVRTVDISPDGKTLLTAGDDRTLKLWDLSTFELKKTLKGHTGIIYNARISPDGSRILSASKDATARLWDVKTGKSIETFRNGERIVRRVGFSPDGRSFFTSRWDARVRVFESEFLQLRAMFRGGSDSACMSRNNRLIATSGSGDTAYVYRVNLNDPTDKQQQQINKLIQDFDDDDYDVREAASKAMIEMGLVAAPSLRIAMEFPSAEVSLRASRARRAIFSPEPDVKLGGHAGSVEAVCFSPDDRLLVTGCRRGSIRVWDVKTWKLVRELDNPLDQREE
jgi:WD40 repeat protein